MESFEVFLGKSVFFLQLLGVVPVFQWRAMRFRKWFLAALCVNFLFIYWTGVALSFFGKPVEGNNVSRISNNMQLLSNGCSFSIVLISSVWKVDQYLRIIDQFRKIDEQLREVGLFVDYKRARIWSILLTVVLFKILVIWLSLDCYVNVIKFRTVTLAFWSLHAVPRLLYILCLYHAASIIYMVHQRCKLVAQIVWVTKKKRRTYGMVSVGGAEPTMGGLEDVQRVYQMMNTVQKLCQRINDYFGIIFLVTLATLFAVTSIQCLYCLIFIWKFDPEVNTIFSVISPILVVVINVSLVVSIATVADLIPSDASNIFIKFSAQPATNEKMIGEFNGWLNQITVSAFRFFTIDHSFLCNYISALITYLVILIQFNLSTGDAYNMQVLTGHTTPKPMGGK